jgi:hypothetical protein
MSTSKEKEIRLKNSAIYITLLIIIIRIVIIIVINSVAVVRKRTIQTERPPLVGEVSASLRG